MAAAFVTASSVLKSTTWLGRPVVPVCTRIRPACPGGTIRKCKPGVVQMNFGGGFLGVGPAEVVVVVIVGWFVLGPRELVRVSKEVGNFLGQLRATADDARVTLTQALEVENLGLEYQKTVDAFKTGYEEGVQDQPLSFGGDDAENDDKEQQNGEVDDAEEVDDGERVGRGGDAATEVESSAEEAMQEDPDDVLQPDEFVQETAREHEDELEVAARRFRDQLRRVNEENQVAPLQVVPTSGEAAETMLPDLEIDADEIQSVELEYIDARAQLELEQLDRKYAEMKRKIVEKQSSERQKLESK